MRTFDSPRSTKTDDVQQAASLASSSKYYGQTYGLEEVAKWPKQVRRADGLVLDYFKDPEARLCVWTHEKKNSRGHVKISDGDGEIRGAFYEGRTNVSGRYEQRPGQPMTLISSTFVESVRDR